MTMRIDGDVTRASNEGPALIEIMLDRFDTETLKRLGAELSPNAGGHAAKSN